MKISTLAVATVTLPFAYGQLEVPRQMRGAAGGRSIDGNAEEKKKIVDTLPIKEAAVALQLKANVDAPESTANMSNDAAADDAATGIISDAWKYETSKWEARGIKANVSLDVEAFDKAIHSWSDQLCNLGITATLFDKDSNMVYQKSVGTKYTPFAKGGYSMSSSPGHGPLVDGWTEDTVYTPYSNSKVVAAATYLASVVDTGLGYLDEPISTTFTNLKNSKVGQMTPRHMLSHTSGLKIFVREDPTNDPYYKCKYDETTTLRECVETFLLTDDSMSTTPGSMMAYNNDAFDILAVLAVEKTGLISWGRILKKYITRPLGMMETTYNCPPVKSTNKKPGVAWGLCSTGKDFPKFVQMLSNGGMNASGEQVLTKNSVLQILSEGTGTAVNTGDLLWGGGLPFYMTRCYPRMVKGAYGLDDSIPLNSVSGYGLGTMFFLGNQGEIKGHGGSTGGTWLIAPGRFSAYLVWMCSGAGAGAVNAQICGNGYALVADILNALESSSSVTITNGFYEKDGPQEIEMCGGYVDLFAAVGISSYSQAIPPATCSDVENGHAAETVHPLVGAPKLAGQIL